MQKVFKFPKVFVPFILLSLFLLYSCDSNNSGEFVCEFDEMQERFTNTDCIADEMVTGCTNLSCGGVEVSVGNFDEQCTVVDCETLECERITVETTFPSTIASGFLTELVINPDNGLPSGIAVADEMEFPFTCSFIANQ